MKFGVALLALSSLALATDYDDHGYHWDKETVTTEVEVTVTSPCPTTEVVTQDGHTYTKTYVCHAPLEGLRWLTMMQVDQVHHGR